MLFINKGIFFSHKNIKNIAKNSIGMFKIITRVGIILEIVICVCVYNIQELKIIRQNSVKHTIYSVSTQINKKEMTLE